MTLQQILYFQRVARSGSFTKAARACFVSQTAISRQICALEEELHVTLLERDTAHVKLTLAGEYFFQQVNELTARLEEVVTRTQTIAQEQQTHLTLGIPTILEQHAISQLLRQYHSLHPEVQLSTVAGSRHQLVSQLCRDMSFGKMESFAAAFASRDDILLELPWGKYLNHDSIRRCLMDSANDDRHGILA